MKLLDAQQRQFISKILAALRTVFPGRPTSNFYLYLSEKIGVQRQALRCHGKQMKAVAKDKQGYSQGLWDGFFDTKSLSVRLTHERASCLDCYIRTVSVCGDTNGYPDSKTVERVCNAIDRGLPGKNDIFTKAFVSMCINPNGEANPWFVGWDELKGPNKPKGSSKKFINECKDVAEEILTVFKGSWKKGLPRRVRGITKSWRKGRDWKVKEEESDRYIEQIEEDMKQIEIRQKALQAALLNRMPR